MQKPAPAAKKKADKKAEPEPEPLPAEDFDADEAEDFPDAEETEEEDKEELPPEEKIDDEISEEPEVIPEPSITEDSIIDDDYEDEDLYAADDEEPAIDDSLTEDAEPAEAEDEKIDMELLSKAADAIQTVADAITETKAVKKTNVAADLFEKLRSLSTYLPEEKREEFLESKIRLQLDYIISKLSGRRGLLGTAAILRHQLGKEDVASELDSGKTLLLKVLEYSKNLVRALPDATMVSSLNGQIEDLLSRI